MTGKTGPNDMSCSCLGLGTCFLCVFAILDMYRKFEDIRRLWMGDDNQNRPFFTWCFCFFFFVSTVGLLVNTSWDEKKAGVVSVPLYFVKIYCKNICSLNSIESKQYICLLGVVENCFLSYDCEDRGHRFNPCCCIKFCSTCH